MPLTQPGRRWEYKGYAQHYEGEAGLNVILLPYLAVSLECSEKGVLRCGPKIWQRY
jgi:hypothetical protein